MCFHLDGVTGNTVTDASGNGFDGVIRGARSTDVMPQVFVVKHGSLGGTEWRYNTATPATGWMKVEFDDTSWKQNVSGFGSKLSTYIRSSWTTEKIFTRTTFELKKTPTEATLHVRHDGEATVYLNGVQVAYFDGYSHFYERRALTASQLALLKAGSNLIAVKCHNAGTQGPSNPGYLDVGVSVDDSVVSGSF